MPVEYKDYYKVLGVARTASADEIRKAFRTLARQYHPDVAKDKKHAEEKFKEINEAYEVLSDAEKRKTYDELGSDWNRRGFTPPPGTQAGRRTYTTGKSTGGEDFEFGGTGFSDFFEQMFGRAGGFSKHTRTAEPEVERGEDVEADIMVTLEEAMNGSIRPITLRRNTLCPHCQGSGLLHRKPCPACQGQGHISETHRYQVKIPAGVHDGQRLRIAGQGESGEGGGPPGDLYLRVRMASHPDFRVEGSDLYHDLDFAPWDLALGANVTVPTLSGPVSIKIPAGTQGGQRLRVRSKGLPGRNGEHGDLYVVTRVQIPKTLTEREKHLWQDLARESRFNPHD